MADRALEERDYTHSVAVLSRAMALEPHNPELFKKRADAYFQLEDYTAAIANYKKAISLAPSEATGLASRMADAYFKSGKVLCTQNKLEDGLEAFTRASQLNPEDQECTLQRWVWLHTQLHVFSCTESVRPYLFSCINYNLMYWYMLSPCNQLHLVGCSRACCLSVLPESPVSSL